MVKETITNNPLVYFSFFLRGGGRVVGVGGRLFEAGRTFTPYRIGANSKLGA